MSYQFQQNIDKSIVVTNDASPWFIARVEPWEWAAKAFEQLLAERDRLAIKLAEKAGKP